VALHLVGRERRVGEQHGDLAERALLDGRVRRRAQPRMERDDLLFLVVEKGEERAHLALHPGALVRRRGRADLERHGARSVGAALDEAAVQVRLVAPQLRRAVARELEAPRAHARVTAKRRQPAHHVLAPALQRVLGVGGSGHAGAQEREHLRAVRPHDDVRRAAHVASLEALAHALVHVVHSDITNASRSARASGESFIASPCADGE
jgi:hypothetical protein